MGEGQDDADLWSDDNWNKVTSVMHNALLS